MRNSAMIILTLSMLTSCSAPPHIFVVKTDEPAKEAVLTINGESIKLAEKNGQFAGDSYVSNGSGDIRVVLLSGRTAICKIDYITNGESEPHRFNVGNGQCIASQ
jgi:hypothetical protein